MVDIFAMTLKVISRSFNIELNICRPPKKLDRFFCYLKVISRPFKLALLMSPVLVSLSVIALK